MQLKMIKHKKGFFFSGKEKAFFKCKVKSEKRKV